jgi:hypothetical protein
VADAGAIPVSYRLILEGPDGSATQTVIGELTLDVPVRFESGRLIPERVGVELTDSLEKAAATIRAEGEKL